MQFDEKPFVLKHNASRLTHPLAMSQNISQVISQAKNLFQIPPHHPYKLVINGQHQNESSLLGELSLRELVELELVQQSSSVSDLVTLTVYLMNENDCKLHEWSASLSTSVEDAKQILQDHTEMDLSLYDVFIDNDLIDRNVRLGKIPDLKDLLKKSVAHKTHQPASEQTRNTEEKNVFFSLAGNHHVKVPVNWSAKVGSLKPLLIEHFDLPAVTIQKWTVNGRDLDDEQPLSNQVESEHTIIRVEILHSFLFKITSQGQTIEKTLSVNAKRSVEDLKIILEKEVNIVHHNQIWYLDETKDRLEDSVKLLDFINNNENTKVTIHIRAQLENQDPKAKSPIKKSYSFEHKEKIVRKELSIDEDISAVLPFLTEAFNLSADSQITLKHNKNTFDVSKRLLDYMHEAHGPISVETQDLKILAIINGEKRELLAANTKAIHEVKDQACKMLNVENSHHYSLLFDINIDETSHLIHEFHTLGEEFIWKFCSHFLTLSLLTTGETNSITNKKAPVSSVKIVESEHQILLPQEFRSTSELVIPESIGHVSREGLDELQASGSAQFSESELKMLLQHLNNKNVYIVDLRQESHGFVNGLPVAWYKRPNWENKGLQNHEIHEKETLLLQELAQTQEFSGKTLYPKRFSFYKPSEPVSFSVESAISEQQTVKRNNGNYQRFYATDHLPPSDIIVDEFITFVSQLPKDAWLHFHCRAGKGRTTTFMVLYDILKNGQNVSLYDIIIRQNLLGGVDLRAVNIKNIMKWGLPKYKTRMDKIRLFYNFVRDPKGLHHISWQEWIANENNLKFTEPACGFGRIFFRKVSKELDGKERCCGE
jgi:hypothetical protein